MTPACWYYDRRRTGFLRNEDMLSIADMIAIITDILRLEEDDYYGSGQTGFKWVFTVKRVGISNRNSKNTLKISV